MVTLSKESKKALDMLAKKRETSVSKTAAELIEFALNIQEDFYLDDSATRRMMQNFTTLGHDDFWK